MLRRRSAAVIGAIATVSLAALSTTPAHASEAIAKKARCVSCHAVDKKRVGPAYRDVAAKYRGDAGAPERLAAKVRAGGSGVWGQVPMLPHPVEQISDEDLHAVIGWVLALE